jgi:hypothetical protein
MKQCSKCNELKPFEMFSKRKDSKDGLAYRCKECHKNEQKPDYYKTYYKKKVDLYKQRAIKWRESNNNRYKENTKKWRTIKHDYYIEGINKHLNSIQPGIYMIKNLINGERYIGQSKRPYTRRVAHFSIYSNPESKNNSTNSQLQSAMKQYGPESFIFGIIEHCEPELLLERESYWINQLNPEYNLATLKA